MGKRGPKPSAISKSVLGTRVTDKTRAALVTAASVSGRTLADETEYRLNRSFDEDESLEVRLGGRPVYALLRLIASTLAPAGETAFFVKHFKSGSEGLWLQDPNAFDQAVRAANAVLEALRPAGDISAPAHFEQSPLHGDKFNETLKVVKRAMEDLGGGLARSMIAEVADADPNAAVLPRAASKRKILARRIAADLGPIAPKRKRL